MSTLLGFFSISFLSRDCPYKRQRLLASRPFRVGAGLCFSSSARGIKTLFTRGDSQSGVGHVTTWIEFFWSHGAKRFSHLSSHTSAEIQGARQNCKAARVRTLRNGRACRGSHLTGPYREQQQQQLQQHQATATLMAACQDQNEIQPPMMCPDLPDHGARVQRPAHALAPQLPNQPAASALQLPLAPAPAPALAPQLPDQPAASAQAQVQLPASAPASALQLRHQPPASFLQIPDAALLLICKAGSKRWEAGPYTAQALRCTCRSLRASVDSLIDHLYLNTAIEEVSVEGYGCCCQDMLYTTTPLTP